MCKKSVAVLFISRQIKTTPSSCFNHLINESPLSEKDKQFIQDIKKGYSYKELAYKWCKSESTIYKWKRNIFETLHDFESDNPRLI